jgi:hypothetical protein
LSISFHQFNFTIWDYSSGNEKGLMDNKEVMDRLQEYYLTQDPKVVALCLASAMIDINRIYNLNDLPQAESESLRVRITLLVKELHKFIEKGPSGDIIFVKTYSEKK